MKIQKKKKWGFPGGGGAGWEGGQGGCEQRIEVIVEMQTKIGEGGGGQVRPGMGVDREGVGW